MALISKKNARFLGGAAALGIAARSVIPAAGSAFALPGLNQDGLFGFYLPATAGVIAFFPDVLPFKGQTRILAIVLLAIGVNALFFQNRTAFTLDNAAFAYAPAVAGALLVA